MFTYVDLIAVLIVIIYVVDGYRQGFVKQLFDLIGIVISFLLAVKFYPEVAVALSSLGLASNLTKPIGFFVLWSIVQIIFYVGGFYLFRYLPDRWHFNGTNKAFGLVAGLCKGTIIVSIFLILMMVLPLGSSIKELLSNSAVTGRLIKATAKAESQVNTALWQMNNSLGFIGMVPDNGKDNELGFKTNNYKIDESSEQLMIEIVNRERAKMGVAPLKENVLLRNVARAHSMDMIIQGYFSHTDILGAKPSDRLTLAGADYRITGENLALAPSVDLAIVGLMGSTKHRENILDPTFKRIGIGVLDVGFYGKMFTQVFTD